MLRHLRVTNFAILSDVEIELGTGMNVLTGETGAGKSLIVEAVNLLRGGRASADIPRAGSDLTAESVQAYAKDNLARFKVPKYIRVVEAFPLTASGKIQKFRLREMHEAELKCAPQ